MTSPLSHPWLLKRIQANDPRLSRSHPECEAIGDLLAQAGTNPSQETLRPLLKRCRYAGPGAALLLLYILNALSYGKEMAHPQLRRICLGLVWMHGYYDLFLPLLLRYFLWLPLQKLFLPRSCP